MSREKNSEVYEEILISMDRVKLVDFISDMKKSKTKEEIVNNIIVPALERIGNLWEKGILALSQVYMSGRLTEQLINEVFNERNKKASQNPKIGLAVLEDHHSLGSQIIDFLLKSYGINTIKYEPGISSKKLVDYISKDNIEIILISTLMLRSALKIKEFTKLLKERGLNVKVIVGGAPFNFDKELYRKVGADLAGSNAFDSINLIKNLIGDINE